VINSMTRPLPHVAEKDANRRLGEHLLAVVRAQDAVIPAHRRVPRTVAEMRARLAQQTPAHVDASDERPPLPARKPGATNPPKPRALVALASGSVAEMRARLAQQTQAADDACPICGYWTCRCGKQSDTGSSVPSPATASDGGGQCSVCGGWFPGWPGGVCSACNSR
jgi:hypothetical protein